MVQNEFRRKTHAPPIFWIEGPLTSTSCVQNHAAVRRASHPDVTCYLVCAMGCTDSLKLIAMPRDNRIRPICAKKFPPLWTCGRTIEPVAVCARWLVASPADSGRRDDE